MTQKFVENQEVIVAYEHDPDIHIEGRCTFLRVDLGSKGHIVQYDESDDTYKVFFNEVSTIDGPYKNILQWIGAECLVGA